jgi:asparagine synthetase B (glutamine-hydrolysing)
MCGLCGVLSPNLSHKQQNIFQELMIVSALRGPWGSGMVAVPKDTRRPLEILRNPDITSGELAHGGDFYRVTTGKKKEFVCMMGHARMPTSGDMSIDCCHPHEKNGIIGMHNGTMTLVNGQKVGKNDSDSKMLIDAIAEHGLEKALDRSEGAYALTILNKTAGTLSFIRNNDRPLYFARAPDVDDGLYWASEMGMLRMVLERRERFKKSKKLQYLQATPFIILNFRLINLGIPELLGTVDTLAKKRGETVQDNSDKQASANSSVRHITCRPYSLTKEELLIALASGCANCTEGATYEDYMQGKTHFYKQNEFMCHTCLQMDPTAQQYFVSHGLEIPRGIKPIIDISTPVHH